MSVELSLLLVAILVTLFVLFAKWSHSYWIRKGAPQAKPHLIFGNVFSSVSGKKSLCDMYADMYFYGKNAGLKFFGIYSFWSPEVVIIDRQLIKTILTKDFQYVSSHGTFHHKSNPLLMNIFNLYGQPWKDRRMKISPMFTTGRIKAIFVTLIEKSDNLVKYLSKHADEKKPVQTKDAMAKFTTDNITNVLFGIDTDSFNKSNELFRKLGIEISKPRWVNVLLEKLVPHNVLGNLGYKTFPADIANGFSKLMRDIIKYREENDFRRDDFLDLMLQLKKYGSLVQDNGERQKEKFYLNDDEILAESFVIFFGGFDTSSGASSFALFELSRNPVIQEKLRKEILTVLEKYNGKLTYECLGEMIYLDQVIKETLRLYPVVSFIPRECTQSYKIPGTDVVIEKGTKVNIPISGLQRDPEFYENPEEFNPDNFSQEKIDQRPEFTWLPFGFGPRLCIGMRLGLIQSKLGVVAALRNFKLSLHESMKAPYETSPGSLLLTFRKDPLINFTKLE